MSPALIVLSTLAATAFIMAYTVAMVLCGIRLGRDFEDIATRLMAIFFVISVALGLLWLLALPSPRQPGPKAPAAQTQGSAP